MDIQEAMAQAGLNQQIQSAIADPAFSDLLWTQDLHFWVRDTIQTNYATLRSRQDLLKRGPSQSHARGRIAHINERTEAPTATVTIHAPTQDFLHRPSDRDALLEGNAPGSGQ